MVVAFHERQSRACERVGAVGHRLDRPVYAVGRVYFAGSCGGHTASLPRYTPDGVGAAPRSGVLWQNAHAEDDTLSYVFRQ